MKIFREDYRLKKIAKLVSNREKVLDLGCADITNPYLKNSDITGFDLKKECKLGSNYSSFISGDVMKLDSYFAEDQKFDAVIAGELLEHLEEPILFFKKCYSILKDDGIIVLSSPNPNSFVERFLTLALSRKYFFTDDHIMLYPQRWLIRIMEISGFTDIKLHSGGMIFPFTALIPFPRPWCYQTIAIGYKKKTVEE